MTRGFITIATGKEMYYKLALNLLKSYRLYSRILCPLRLCVTGKTIIQSSLTR